MAWYNKYRPNNFENVIGQELVKTVLQNSLSQNKVKHAYLFAGPKGTGKTTLARIFANQLLVESSEPAIDIIELDAASNTGIDNVRQLIESAGTPPMSGKYKVYIIDEVHMLSKQAMNALLKTLEEPPQYLIFLLATTNPEKLIPTVLSRLTKLNLTSHTIADLVSNLEKISILENLKIDTAALEFIAKRAGGGQRDAINLLETISGYSLENYSLESVSNILGFLPTDLLLEIGEYFCLGIGEIKNLLTKVTKTALDGETFLQQLLEFLLDLALEGDERFDNLIWVCSEILSLKLPITSVVSIFALIQSRIRKPRL
jgi:DNA polymerase III subunit gamma/tau